MAVSKLWQRCAKNTQHTRVEQPWILCLSQNKGLIFHRLRKKRLERGLIFEIRSRTLTRFKVLWPKFALIHCRVSYAKHCFIWKWQSSNQIKCTGIFSSGSRELQAWNSGFLFTRSTGPAHQLSAIVENHICENANVGVHLIDFCPHQVGFRQKPTRHFPHHFVPESIMLPLQLWPPLNWTTHLARELPIKVREPCFHQRNDISASVLVQHCSPQQFLLN